MCEEASLALPTLYLPEGGGKWSVVGNDRIWCRIQLDDVTERDKL